MKNRYKVALLIIVTVLLNKIVIAQTWPVWGAHWEYCRGGLGADTRVFEYTKDTIINSTTYQVIERLNVPPMPYVGSVYTRYSNDTVYRYVQSKEVLFLVFNAHLNDVYTTFRTNLDSFADSTCNSILPVKVLQLDTLNYGSLTLRRWKLNDTLFDYIYSGSAYPSSIWQVTERIGFMNDFPFTPTMSFTGNSCVLATDMSSGYFLHAYSDSLYSYTASWNCNWAVDVFDELNEKDFNVYPNPAKDELNILLSEVRTPVTLSMYDLLGNEVFRCGLDKKTTQITVEKFPNGLYFLKCSTDDHSLTKKIIINH
jgi:hypothetical protein